MMQPVPPTYRKWVVARPVRGNVIRPENFEMLELAMPEVEDGKALVRTRLVNLHSQTRRKLPIPDQEPRQGQIALGETDGSNYGLAEVLVSRDRTLRAGDVIHWQVGWQEYEIVSSEDGPIGYAPPGEQVRALNGTNAPMNYVLRPEIASHWPSNVLMHVFGTSGTTACMGLRKCGPVTPRDRVLVAAASGAVGSLAAQMAKARGAYVVGLAGGSDRCDWVVETLGIDACVDYRAPGLESRLRSAFPNGIDLFSDGVGGALTDLVVPLMNLGSRLFSYGSSASFYADRAQARPNGGLRASFGISPQVEQMAQARGIAIECWIVFDHYQDRLSVEDELAGMLRDGSIRAVTNVTHGFENLPQAIIDMYMRPHAGKAQVSFER